MTDPSDDLFTAPFAPAQPYAGRWYIGTSGYVFSDWVGTVYPERLSERRMLAYYLEHFQFNALELNFTFYHMPAAAQLARFAQRVPPRFQLAVKAHQSLTHERPAPDDHTPFRTFAAALAPLQATHTLAAVLLQFPYSFQYAPAATEWLRRCRDELPELPLAIEFRHESWCRAEAVTLLKSLTCVFCMVDGPRLRGLMPLFCADTGAFLYLRLHGRNQKWFSGGAKERYNYDYSEAELREILQRVQALADQTKKVLVFFNNCYMGRAVTNALRFRALIEES
ncbi:MAG: DUF72 domain-containing protein [bacterium]|nr:DUF72 domain-containing protein [bacterium]